MFTNRVWWKHLYIIYICNLFLLYICIFTLIHLCVTVGRKKLYNSPQYAHQCKYRTGFLFINSCHCSFISLLNFTFCLWKCTSTRLYFVVYQEFERVLSCHEYFECVRCVWKFCRKCYKPNEMYEDLIYGDYDGS